MSFTVEDISNPFFVPQLGMVLIISGIWLVAHHAGQVLVNGITPYAFENIMLNVESQVLSFLRRVFFEESEVRAQD